MQAPATNAPNPNSREELAAMLADLFDACVGGYLWSLDNEHWAALFEYGQLIDRIHAFEEQVAA